jgi:hypothetical protein
MRGWAVTMNASPTPPESPPPDRWAFVVQSTGKGPPCVVRVRKLLKLAWRAFGLRCLSARELKPTEQGGNIDEV